MPDFDPFQIPAQLSAWLLGATEAEREKHATEFAKRAVAAFHVPLDVVELRAALAKRDDPRLRAVIPDMEELARDLHDYDTTSD